MSETLVVPQCASLDSVQIQKIIAALELGLIVCAPTETRYGLLVRADSEAALARLFDVKQRPAQMPSAIFARGRADFSAYAQVSELAERLIDCFLPGPLTLVLPAAASFASHVSPNGMIGIRWSTDKIINSIVQAAPFPLTATSANLFGGRETDSCDAVRNQFGEQISLYLDAGIRNGSVSTVLQLTDSQVRILRSGPITQDAIDRCLSKAEAIHG